MSADGLADLSVNEPITKHELGQAFDVFNQLSQELVGSYRTLEDQVKHLSAELQSAKLEAQQETQAKQSLADQLESLLNFLPAGVVVVNHEGIIVQSNPAAEVFFGGYLVGQLWDKAYSRLVVEQANSRDEVLLQNGKWVRCQVRTLEEQNKKLVLITDETETRYMQQQIHRIDRLQTMGKMAASLAHQIRTPLSAAMLYTGQLSQWSHEQALVSSIAEKLSNRHQQIETQIQDMLNFAKGDLVVNQRLSVDKLITATQELMQPKLAASDFIINWRIETQSLVVLCNQEALVGAITNLINNALEADYDASSKQIDIISRANKRNYLTIEIKDNGLGIDGDAMQKLEQAFYTTKSQGTGLGLSVVKAVVEAHQGFFELQSGVGEGTLATITLPYVQ